VQCNSCDAKSLALGIMQNQYPTGYCWVEEPAGRIGRKHITISGVIGVALVIPQKRATPSHICSPRPFSIIDSSAANTPLRESHVACHMAPISTYFAPPPPESDPVCLADNPRRWKITLRCSLCSTRNDQPARPPPSFSPNRGAKIKRPRMCLLRPSYIRFAWGQGRIQNPQLAWLCA
jgi:hypothetical protein